MSATVTPAEARRLWTFLEPVHVVTYFTPEARAAFEAAGLRGFWRGYFAGRSAPLGPVGAAPVTALFFVFAPHTVARALPDVWTRAEPAAVLDARLAGAVAALGPASAGIPVKEAADLLMEAAAGATTVGRALAAANAALPVPDDDLARLWQAATVLREHRGDGHMASLVAAGVDGCEALVWREACDGTPGDMRSTRAWSDDEWTAARERLTERGWLDRDGGLTTTGREQHDRLEEQTDRLAVQPWTALDDRHRERLAEILTPLVRALYNVIPFPNAVGLPRSV